MTEYGVAADIGTTNIALALLDLSSGGVLAEHSFANPQRRYGADVVSRIAAASGGAAEEMRRLVTEGAAAGIETLAAGRKAGRIAVAGNTVMTHLLLGFDCEGLGAAPFRPGGRVEGDYRLFGAAARVFPWISAFVGGDVVAGLLHVPKRDRFLLIDLGTNGEMALYDRGKLSVASAAAGPAFERAGQTASAVIAGLARLIREGYIDGTGLLAEGAPGPFTQKGVRALQLAKAAVRAGLDVLLEEAELSFDSLDAVYLAGGAGQALNPENAETVGLLPPGLAGRIIPAGNAALGGAVRMLREPEWAAAETAALLAAAREVPLAGDPRFAELFIEYMRFPP